MKWFLIVSSVICASLAMDCEKEWDESKIQITRTSEEFSPAKDGSTAFAWCPERYSLVGCQCVAAGNVDNGCDGVRFQTDQGDVKREVCAAYNGKEGKGVKARAICQRTWITCDSGVKDMPRVKCPKYYKVHSCALHATHMHMLWRGKEGGKKPVAKNGGNQCFTTKGCSECSVEARCRRKVYSEGPGSGNK